MTNRAAQSGFTVSRRQALRWTLLLIVPNLALFAWLFFSVNPLKVIGDIYSISEGVPWTNGLPAAILVLAAGCAFLRSRRGAMFQSAADFVFSPRGSAALFLGLCILVAVPLGFSFFLNLFRAAAGAAVLFCAAGIGLRALELKWIGLDARRFESPLERFVLATALGLGAVSLLVFIAASLGVMNPWIWRAAIAGLCAVNFNPVRGVAAELFQACRKRTGETSPFVFAAALFAAFFLLSHAPLIWNLPSEYDVLEYHLAAPAEYLRAGSAGFLRENIYATFPENGEMLFLLPMMLAGDKLAGLAGAHVILLAAWMLAIGGVYALVRRLERSLAVPHDRVLSPGPAVAALLFALVPMGSQLGADFYVEHFQALFHVAAMLCGVAFLSDFKIGCLFKAHAQSNAPGWLICAGIFAGLTCGAKYTGLIFTLLPLAAFLPFYCALTGTPLDGFVAALRLGLPAILVFAPWCARNWLASGDCLYPLGTVLRRRVYGASGIPDRLDHFEAAHRAGETSWRAAWSTLRELMPGFRARADGENNRLVRLFLFVRDDIRLGPQLGIFALPSFSSVTNAETALVAFVFIADLLLWFFFSLHNDRFLFPHLTALAALGGLGMARLWIVRPLRKVAVALCCASILLFTPLQMIWPWVSSSLGNVARPVELPDAAMNQFGDQPPTALAGGLAEAHLPAGSRALFIGEAQTFYCARTPYYSVVFNESLLEEALHKTNSADEAIKYLRDRAVTHLYFNFAEWFRLDTSYALELSDDEKRWQIVNWDDGALLSKQHERLKTQLRAHEFRKYGLMWPDNVHPAYLKLSTVEYERLDEIYRNHTRLVWPEQASNLEMRELK